MTHINIPCFSVFSVSDCQWKWFLSYPPQSRVWNAIQSSFVFGYVRNHLSKIRRKTGLHIFHENVSPFFTWNDVNRIGRFERKVMACAWIVEFFLYRSFCVVRERIFFCAFSSRYSDIFVDLNDLNKLNVPPHNRKRQVYFLFNRGADLQFNEYVCA